MSLFLRSKMKKNDAFMRLKVPKTAGGIVNWNVKLTLPKESNIYASEYQLYLPSKEEFKKQMEEVTHYGTNSENIKIVEVEIFGNLKINNNIKRET